MPKKLTTEEFINKARCVHGDKYNYSKVDYINSSTKVCIICPEHGEFWQAPQSHLNGNGCYLCGVSKRAKKKKKNVDDFIREANIIHGGKYDYSKVEYNGNNDKVCIICPEHGEFWQKPNNHIHGWGCSRCSKTYKKTTEEFIQESKLVFGDKFEYSNCVYTTRKNKVTITCKKHGDFTIYPGDHLRGQGCPLCTISHLENDIKNILTKNKIKFIWQYSNEKLGAQRIDFYLPEYKIAIECQGIQHFVPIKFFGGEQKHSMQKAWDIRKRKICEDNGVLMLYYTDKKIYVENATKMQKNTFFSKELLVETIKARI